MTRETKIGLLVGLAFIIVIGILLSDHMTSTTEPPKAPLSVAGNNLRESVVTPAAPNAAPPVAAVGQRLRGAEPARADGRRPVPTHAGQRADDSGRPRRTTAAVANRRPTGPGRDPAAGPAATAAAGGGPGAASHIAAEPTRDCCRPRAAGRPRTRSSRWRCGTARSSCRLATTPRGSSPSRWASSASTRRSRVTACRSWRRGSWAPARRPTAMRSSDSTRASSRTRTRSWRAAPT